MRVLVVTAPTAPVVTLDEAKQHLEIQSDDWDALIEDKIDAAVQHLDGPMGWLGRALASQELELRGDLFGGEIDLPFPPVVSVTSVRYLDVDGVEQLLDPTRYEVRGSTILPAWQKPWPSARKTGEGVRVGYTAGYTKVPATIRAAVLLLVGDMFRFRDTVIVDAKSEAVAMSSTVENLLRPWRIY